MGDSWCGKVARVAWEEELFAVLDDLEQQAATLYDEERGLELADRSRAEYQSVTLAGRLMASLDLEVVLEVLGIGVLRGRLARVATGWVLLRGAAQDWVVPTTALRSAEQLSDRAVPEVAWSPLTRLGLGSALRRLADAQERCLLHGTDGGRHEGRLGRVGADFVEVLTGPDGSRTTLVPFATLAAVQSRD